MKISSSLVATDRVYLEFRKEIENKHTRYRK
jgi:hypothetical protein